MCRGLGILANFKEIKCIENNTEHSKIEGTNKLDEYCKIEIIRDDTIKCGYKIKLDDQIDDNVKEIWQNKKFITSEGKMDKKLFSFVSRWCRENEFIIWKSFAKSCSTYATIKGNNYQFGSTIKGDNNQSGSTIEGNNYQSGSTIKGNNSQS